MALSALDDKSRHPEEEELAEVLAGTSGLWDELKSVIASRYRPLAEDWVFSGKKWGWALRLKHKKRAVLYMTPCRGHFLVGFALGEKAVQAARRSDLPASVLDAIDGARKYAEGRAVRLEVRSREDVRHVETVAVAKMST